MGKVGCSGEGSTFESHLGKDWKNLTVHPAVDEKLTIIGEGLGGERRGLDTAFHML